MSHDFECELEVYVCLSTVTTWAMTLSVSWRFISVCLSVYSNDVSHDFECELEVYCHKLHDDLTIASTPKKLKKKFNNISHSVGRSVGRRLSGLVGRFYIIYFVSILWNIKDIIMNIWLLKTFNLYDET